MTTRSGRRTGGQGHLLDPFITENGEYTVETAKSLLGHYRASKLGDTPTMIDLSGNGLNASPGSSGYTLSHTTDSPYANGYFDRKLLESKLGSIDFPGDSPDGLVTPATSRFSAYKSSSGDRTISISFWAYGLPGKDCNVMGYGPSVSNPDLQDRWQINGSASSGGDRLGFTLYSSGGRIRSNFNDVFSASEWVHVVVTYDGTGETNTNDSIALYVNGEVKSRTGTDNNGTYGSQEEDASTDVLCIGDGNFDEFNGKLSEISLFRKVLNQREAKALYEAKDGYDHAHSGDVIDSMHSGLRHVGLKHLVIKKSGYKNDPVRLQLRDRDLSLIHI